MIQRGIRGHCCCLKGPKPKSNFTTYKIWLWKKYTSSININTNRMWLVLTTQLHLLTLFVPPECNSQFDFYPSVILIATIASSLWHLTGERTLWITVLDMTFAQLWFFLDIIHAVQFHSYTVLIQVLYLNMAVAAIHIILEFNREDRRAYILNHSLWHILSAGKCLAIASLLQCSVTA